MKTHKLIYCILLIFITVPLHLAAQNKEVPVTTSSNEAKDLFLEAREQIENMETIAATDLLDQAIAKDPGFATAYLYRSQSGGGFNVFRQNLDKAVSLADNVSEGEKYQILYTQAQADGNGVKAKEYLDLLLKDFLSDKRIQTQAGTHFFGNQDYSQALDHFTKAVKLDKDYAAAYNMIGYCQSALNNFPEAEKAFQTYIQLVPENGNPYDSYAELLLKMGKYDESIAQYKMAFEKDPVNLVVSLSGIGHNYIFKGDFEAARNYYQESFDKATTPSGKLSALYWKATSFLHEGKVDEAVNAFDDYRSLAEKENLSTNAIYSYANQGFILTETGNSAEGMKYYEKAIDLIGKSEFSKIDKDNFMTQAGLWKYYNLTAKGDFEKARAEADKVKQKIESRQNQNEEMLFNSLLGYAAYKMGDFDQAIQLYSKADAEDPLNWYYQAMGYHKKGDNQKAATILEKIKTSNVNTLNLALVRNKALENLAMEDFKSDR